MTEQAPTGRARHLPRGPHGLPREEVERSQRERLLMGAASAVAEKGYPATSVEDIIRRAGVSRTTFYQLYDDKLDCFLAANSAAAELVADAMLDHLDGAGADDSTAPVDKLDRLLGVYLGTLADNPAMARVFLVEVYAAGPSAVRQRQLSLETFIDMAAAIIGEIPDAFGGPQHQRFAAQVLIDSVSARVTAMVGIGEAHRLPELHGPLMEFLRQVI